MSSIFQWAVIILVGFGVVSWLRNGTNSVCDGRTKRLIDQIPPSLDVLASRHPLSIGLLRNYLNDKGQFDKFSQDLISALASADKKDANDTFLSCSLQSVAIRIAPDEIRKKIAEQAENTLGIKTLP